MKTTTVNRARIRIQGIALIATLSILFATQPVLADGPPGQMHRAQQQPPIRLGTSGLNSNDACGAGTLGSLVIKTTPVFFPFILSNNHVIARTNNGRIGDPIVHRAPLDTVPACSKTGNFRVATLSDFRTIKCDGSDNLVDAAIASIIPGKVNVRGFILDIGPPSNITAPPTLALAVQKSGRTTGLTRGRISMIDATVMVTYPGCGIAKFIHQIEWVSPDLDAPTCRPGDSGSLLVTDRRARPNPVGLVFAGNAATNICLANPIRTVLQSFGIGFPLSPDQKPDDETEVEPAADPAVDFATNVKDRYDEYLLALPEVVGTGVARAADGSGNVVIRLLLRSKTEAAVAAAPAEVEGVPVEIEVVGDLRPL
jgi:hypothetical protein